MSEVNKADPSTDGKDRTTRGAQLETQLETQLGTSLGTPDFARLHIWQIQAFRDFLVVGVIVGVIWAGYAMRFVTVPLLLAFALAYLVEPLVRWLCRVLKLSRPLAVSLILVLSGIGAVAGALLVVPPIIAQTIDVSNSVREGKFDVWINRVQAVLPTQYQADVDRARQFFGIATVETKESPTQNSAPVESVLSVNATPTTAPNADISIVQSLVSPTAQSALWKVLDFSGLVFASVLIPFYFWFFSVGFPGALQFLGKLVPTSHQPKVFRLASEMDAAVAGFMRGRILIAAGMGVMFAGGWVINGVPYALTLGLLAGILSIVPYLGAVVVLPAVGLLAASQLSVEESHRLAWYWIVGGPPLVFVIVQSIEGYLLTPIFAGRATNLGPVSIFVAVLAGASVAGLYGMLLAIPVAACTKILMKETMMPALRNWAEGRSADPLPMRRE